MMHELIWIHVPDPANGVFTTWHIRRKKDNKLIATVERYMASDWAVHVDGARLCYESEREVRIFLQGAAVREDDPEAASGVVDAQVLTAALLWLRNRYDAYDPKSRKEVLARIGKVLEAAGDLSVDDLKRFRKQFPADEGTTK